MTTPCFWVEPTNEDPGAERRWVRPGWDYTDGWTDRTLPPGAMLDAWWYHEITGWTGPDGIALVVVLPPEHVRSDEGYVGRVDNRGNWWHVDGPSRNNGVPGPGWTRTGDPRNPPTLSVIPSINTCDYHGFLTNGVLGVDLGGHVQR